MNNEMQKLLEKLLIILEKEKDCDTEASRSLIKELLVKWEEADKEDVTARMRVFREYKELFPPHGGLSDFFIWHEEFETRKQLNEEYAQLLEDIEALFNSYPAK